MRALVTLLTLLLLQYDSTCGATDPTYLVAVTSQAVSGTTETLCAHIHEPSTTLSLVVTLSSDNAFVSTILKENSIRSNFYKCVPFQVPVVLVDTVATVYVKIEGASTPLSKKTQILIKPPMKLIFIQTDKPIYKPGETVKFRIVSLDFNFLTRNQKFQTVELQDPKSNRIGQWTNRTTRDGILDLFHRMTPQAAEGNYVITAWDEKNQQTTQYFEIKGYVLPKFEVNVNLPPVLTPTNKEFILNICARYTYGKGVQGSVTAEVCGTSYSYNWYRQSTPKTCRTYVIKTDKTGCASQVINLSEYGMSPGGYFQINYKVEEDGTGITVEGSAGVSYSSDVITVSFVDAADVYKPGIAYGGKVLVTDVYNKPLKGQTVYLFVNYDFISVNMTLTTDSNGTAYFSLDTTVWLSQPAYLQARHIEDKLQNGFWPAAISYNGGSLSLRPFYSKSKSFLKLILTLNPLSCAIDANVEASYIIQGSALKKGQKTLDVFYMVFSKGSMAQNGRVSVNVQFEMENKGKLSFTLKKTTALSPFAQVIVYTLLPNGETVADSWNYPIEQCLPNKVSLTFSSSMAMPKDTTTLNLKAQPGSLCSIRSIDQSVLLLKPEAQLNAAFVFGMLPVQMLGDYPYQVSEYNEDPCIPRDEHPIDPPVLVRDPIGPPMLARARPSLIYYPNRNGNDAYSTFKGIGVKIATNSDVKEPVYCYDYRRPAMDAQPNVRNEMMAFGPPVEKTVQNLIRKSFPETWIWDLVPVGRSGSVPLTKTVPDTITKWATDAFCTSSVGFGVAPSTALTAFLPFFVSLTLPYSVIRGEELTLKATVFNYLSKCIMVKVTLENSDKFSALPCNGCSYTQCLCAEEGKTFEWTVTASVLGAVKVTVRAETVKTQERCGNEVVTVPEGRRVDTVVQSFLVEAEGVKQIITQNELICLTGNQVNTNVSLKLPEVVVKDSEKSFVTVLGDLISHALKNIADLLRMPYGCGEQNMLNFAPNIYILQYLESSGLLTPDILARAKTYLETGYQTQLNYKHDDGSYSAFGNSDPSGHSWLTAYVMKIFRGAKKYVFVDETNIDQAKNWLGQHQQGDGCFITVGILYHNDMKGGVSDDVTLTAYIVAALLELGMTTTDPMVTQGLVCLKEASSNLDNTYFIALAAYTFTLAGDQEMRQMLISNLDNRVKRDGVGRYWTQTNGQLTGSLDVEMTSYVLLALLSGPTLPSFELDYSATIVHWLAKKQNAFGGFSSSQDTVVALHALAKYSAATYSPTGTVVVNVTSPSNQKYNFIVNQSNRLLYQERQLQPPTGNFTLATRGQGCVFVQFALHYNVLPSNSLAFSILTDATSTCERKRFYSVELAFTVRYNGPREETNMVIIDVKLLSGFVLDSSSLQALQQDSRIKLVEQNEGHVMLYLDGMKKEEKSFTVTLLQNVVVKNLKPAVVTVYDYYKTSEGAVKQYTSPCVK
ncbi:alpha-2-macroglobulin-like protein 1 [Triplophysa rosa]|uniref:Alpha-2-macroglobulin-like protein 1 n=1 Tax=Triplophysa rosa TaxID=992332 RepID=A0A9W7T805_TRIRA|nr:alpha-2-macroglobulin-like protein 1 [Triplophysa rosa]KAI7792335.1 putative alpha-2-macroglobulin-like protein 1 [Triplophysa rosa]